MKLKKQGLLAVLDQGLFSSANYIVVMLSAKWMSEMNYGAFSIAFALSIFIFVLYNALIIEPLLVFSAGRYSLQRYKYFAITNCFHLIFCLIAIALLAIIFFVCKLLELVEISDVMLSMIFSQPFILFSIMARRLCMVLFKIQLAVVGSAIYFFILCMGAYFLNENNFLTGKSLIALMGASSAVSGIIIYKIIFKNKRLTLIRKRYLVTVLRRQLHYSKWPLFTRIPMQAPHFLFSIIIPYFGGLSAAASYRALLNMVTPIQQLNSVISVFLIPSFVRSKNTSIFKLIVSKALVIILLVNVFYSIVMILMYEEINYFVYDGKYSINNYVIWILGIQTILSGLVLLLSSIAKALEKPIYIFKATMITSIIAIGLGMLLIVKLSYPGAVISVAVINIFSAIILYYLLYANERNYFRELL